MPTSPAAAYSDAALLIAVQNGNHIVAGDFNRRFTPRLIGMIRSLRPGHNREYVRDALGTTMLMLFNPKVSRFASAEGTLVQYLFRRVKNAIRRTDYEYRPVCIGLRAKSEPEDRKSFQRDAAVVYDNTTGMRSHPGIDTGFIEREVVDFVTANADPNDAKIAHMRYVEEYPMTRIAKTLGLDRFAVARRLKRFREEAAECLALADAA